MLNHPFWTQVIMEEDDAKVCEENNKHSEKGERNCCEKDDSVNVRYVDAVFLIIKYTSQLQRFLLLFFAEVVLLHVKFVYSM